jgi:hypothetical protein
MTTPPALLLIGIHREELAFGRRVAQEVDRSRVTVLEVPEGLSGRRPLPDEEFRYDTLHRELYRQILDHMHQSGERLLIDLHAGRDPLGPSADFICADAEVRARMSEMLERETSAVRQSIRVIPIGGGAQTHARTVIPRELWNNPAFRYVALEIYLPDAAAGRDAACRLAQRLIDRTVECAATEAATPEVKRMEKAPDSLRSGGGDNPS